MIVLLLQQLQKSHCGARVMGSLAAWGGDTFGVNLITFVLRVATVGETKVSRPEEAAMLPATAVARSVGAGVDAGEPHVEQRAGRPGQRTAVIANPVTRGQAAAAALQCRATKSACPGMPATARWISARRLPMKSWNCDGSSASARRW